MILVFIRKSMYITEKMLFYTAFGRLLLMLLNFLKGDFSTLLKRVHTAYVISESLQQSQQKQIKPKTIFSACGLPEFWCYISILLKVCLNI